MRIEGIAEIIDGHHFERSDADRSRIVDENVYRPKVLADLVEGSISFFPHGDIGFDCQDLPPVRPDVCGSTV